MDTARTNVLGIGVDSLRADELVRRVSDLTGHDGPSLICYVNTECLNQAVFDRRYRAILHDADVVYADGMGVVLASRFFGEPLPERVNLGDCLPQLCELCVREGYQIFLLGGAPGVAKRAAARLKRRFPGLQIAGTHHGYFEPEDDQEVIRLINETRPHLLLVGMGVPKQEKWLWTHRKALRVPVLWGVGALFNYFAGVSARAPIWMRRAGLEWLFRLSLEPKRLWRRYLLGNVFFALRAGGLVLMDSALVTAAWLGAHAVRQRLDAVFGFSINPIDPYLEALPFLVGVWLITCTAFGLYRRSSTASVLAELGQITRVTWLGLLVTMAVAFLLKELSLGRSVILLFGVAMPLLLTGSRLLVRAMERSLARRGLGLRPVLIVGTGALARRLRDEIAAWPAGYEVVGFVSDGETDRTIPTSQLLGTVGELGRVIRQHRVREVFVASHNLRLHQKLNLLAGQERWPVNFHVVSGELESFAQRVRLRRAVKLPLLNLPAARVRGWYEVGKRAVDLAGSCFGLLACLPLWVAIPLLVTLESRGPALFAQSRIGKGGKSFRMYKFRTMGAKTGPYAIAPHEGRDPRVTRLGRFLRRWSLDELPQLLNVLRGEMSLIGPRPEMPFLVKQYQPWQRRRLSVRPGLTGLWQVVGRKELPLHRNIEYDLYYVRHRGWLLDLSILLRTIPAVLVRRGAF